MASIWDRLKNGNFGLFGSEGLTSATPGAALGIGVNKMPGAPGGTGLATAPNNPTGSPMGAANQQGRASKFFLGTEGHGETIPYIDPQVQDILSRLAPQLEQRLSQNLQGGGFAPIANQARRNFGQQRQGIAERLNMLSGGEQRGQAGEHYLDSLSADLEGQLASHEAQYGLQEGSQLQNLLGQLMQPRNENLYIPRQPGAVETVTPQIIETFTKLGLAKLIPYLFAL